MMDTASRMPGFFGKLPGHGDFVGRRLPPGVRQHFDAWLQAGLLHSRRVLGTDWLPAWLNSPLWRFVVAAGVCGEQAWSGVLMPSHDRVGRCFPLLLAAGCAGTPSLRACLTVHDAWFARLEEAALAALGDGDGLRELDARLLAAGTAPSPGARAAAHPGGAGTARSGGPVVVALPLTGDAGTDVPAILDEGGSAWWSLGAERVAPVLALCRGMPPPSGFAAFLDGDWKAHGWRG